jgi:esterase/lipase superfamily enzyme
MHTEEHRWFSPHLGREMTLKLYGHWGAPYLVFPCSRGRYYDFEGMGMTAAIAPFIDSGRLKLFALDSVDAESWYDFARPPAERNARHDAYDRYVCDEAIPFVRHHCRDAALRAMATGCSMGAYHAVNCFLRHPDLFAGTLAMSGLYRLDRQEFDIAPGDLQAVYFNSPLSYLPGLNDPWYLERYRCSTIIVCAGQGDWEAEALADTGELQRILGAKGVPARVELWGPEYHHDWPFWYRQMNHYLGQLHGL